MGKRIHAVKVLLDDDERADVMRIAMALDMPPSEVVRRAAMQSMRGSLGLAEARAKRNRGTDSEPSGEDFVRSDFGDLL